jgi:Tfp pilus assembly protein PilF
MNNIQKLQRLDRLENFLREDPNNTTLLADAFHTALEAGEHARAEFHLRHAQALGADGHVWTLHEAHWLMAQGRDDEATAGLRTLSFDDGVPQEVQRAATHDLALVALRRGDFIGARQQIEVIIAGAGSHAPLAPAYQVLWLRILHRMTDLDAAIQWAMGRAASSQLAPDAAGVASLVALDAAQYKTSLEWADLALLHNPTNLEALVARASLALAERAPARARQWLQLALSRNPNDGRAWSALGFADLLDQKLTLARADFDRAVLTMSSHIGTWHGMAWTALLQHDLTGAEHALDMALSLDRNFAESHGALAVLRVLQGRREEAQASIDIARRLERGNFSAQYAQALLNGEASNSQAVRRLAERMFAHQPAPLGGTIKDLLE